MPAALYYTDSAEANKLIAKDPMALLIGFVLDQQVTVQKAFRGPLDLKQRLGTLDPAKLADADLETVFREKPAIHRYPAVMAERTRHLAEHIRDEYDGDASQVWKSAKTADELRENLEALPGIGEMKVKSISAVLAKRFKLKKAEPLVPWHPTLGDVDSSEALLEYQAAKREHKKAWSRKQARS